MVRLVLNIEMSCQKMLDILVHYKALILWYLIQRQPQNILKAQSSSGSINHHQRQQQQRHKQKETVALCNGQSVGLIITSCEFEPHQRLFVSLSKKLYPQCLVLVGPRNEFKCDLHEPNCLFHNWTF